MYQQNLVSNNLQEMICHKIQPTNHPKSIWISGRSWYFYQLAGCWLFCFIAYQPFSGHLMLNWILNNSVLYCWSSVIYFTCTWMLFTYVELCFEMNLTWAWGREDYMLIGAFYDAQMDKSISWAVIGCQLRSSYASVHVYWPAHWHIRVCIEVQPTLFFLPAGC